MIACPSTQSAQNSKVTYCTAINLLHMSYKKHGREIKDANQKAKLHKGYLDMLNKGCNKTMKIEPWYVTAFQNYSHD